MPVHCVAIGCRNTIDIKRKPAVQIELEKVVKITFHSFPSDPVRKAEWIRILGLENKIISNRSRLCSLHFKEKHIDRTSLVCVRLRENAVPHIFEDVDDKMDTNETVSALPEFLDTQVKTEDCFEEPANCKLDTVAVLKCDKGTDTSMSPAKRSTQDKGTRISPERIWTMNFSNMEIIRKASNAEIEHLRKRIRTLKQQISRKDKKIDIIKSMLSL
ncbi:PREDICTED: uncharacterized protein LOC105561407 [Vollenhovia emeryi]|uniref:uncharacterized protein LOC105561407 n=1 Tax=Vollenhovia emeryi TaxID=411798 RepID=UPI0005F3F065|nr:PREDICTED: uncharacterized protein LOC105561407 [Vollenhovia emeryi]